MPSQCEACKQHPMITIVTLGDEPTALCQECLSAIAGVLEDEATEAQFRLRGLEH